MSKTRKSHISPVMALGIIRQILRGDGEYAVICERGDQLDAIGELVDQVLDQKPAAAPVLQLPRVEIFRRVDPTKLAYLEQLVSAASKRDYWIKEVCGDTDVTPVSNMQEAMAAIFNEPLTTVTFETFGATQDQPGPTFWVKCNTNQGEGFFEDWSGDAEWFVKIALSIDPQATR